MQSKLGKLPLGEPIPFSVYSPTGVLLMGVGTVLNSEAQRERLVSMGTQLESPRAKAKPVAPSGYVPVPASTPNLKHSKLKPLPEMQPVPRPVKPAEREIKMPKLKGLQELVQLTIGGQSQVVFAPLVGRLGNHSLLVSAIAADGQPIPLNPGDTVKAKLFSDKSVYFFDSTVLLASPVPAPYFHLKMPDWVIERVLRQNKRVETALDVWVSTRKVDSVTNSAQITDISIKGAKLTCADDMGEVGGTLSILLTFTVAKSRFNFTLEAEIRNVLKTKEGKFKYGVQFKNMTMQAALALQALLHDISDNQD